MTKSMDSFLGFVTAGHCTQSGGCTKHLQRGNIWGKTFGSSGGGGGVQGTVTMIIEMSVMAGIAVVALFGAYILIDDVIIPFIF